MTTSTPALVLAIGLVGFYAAKRLTTSPRSAQLPPGPKGLPLIGNAFQWPREKAWEVFTAWSKIYGDMVYADLAGQPVVILNDPKLALELLDSKSATYSDRPFMYMACELVRWKNIVTMRSYGKPMREQRDLILRAVGSKASVAKYARMEEEETYRFVRRVLEDPARLNDHVRKLAGSIIISIAFGHQVQDGKDEFVDLANKLMHEFGDANAPGRYIVDAFPILDFLPAWFPGLQYRKIAAEMRKTQDDFLTKPYEYVQAQLSAGTARPSFIADQIDGVDVTPELESRVKWATAGLYGGGADTTVSAICTFFLAMTLYPDVQRRAQVEIDTVLGHNTLPTMDDRLRLPYVEALMLEVLRWGQVVPQCVPHVSREDDVHRGRFIPKGSIIIPNIWKFTHDPDIHPDPMTFNPLRFLKTPTHETEADPRQHVFGYGRRVCPGQQLAEHSVWLACATSLATLSVSRQLGQDGTPMTPEVEYIGHIVTHPKDFPCRVEARASTTKALIYDALHMAL